MTWAFSGSPFLWRTKLNDITQIDFLVNNAQREGARTLGLLTTTSGGGESFFNWFGFFATDAGFPEDAVSIKVYNEERSCQEAIIALLQQQPEYVVAVAESREALECIVRALHRGRRPDGRPPTRVLLADTGLEINRDLSELGAAAVGIEGFNSAEDPASGFTEAWAARYGAASPCPPTPPRPSTRSRSSPTG